MFLGKRDRQGRRDPFPFFPNDNPLKMAIMQKRKEEDERWRQMGSGEKDRALRVLLPGTQKKTLLGESGSGEKDRALRVSLKKTLLGE